MQNPHLTTSLESAKRLCESEELQSALQDATQRLIHCLRNGGAVYVFGNGGSAADAQHFVAELVGRLRPNGRRALRAMALTTCPSTMTAIANDFGYAAVFARQLDGVVRRGDVAMGFSTSGTSPNVLAAFDVADYSKAHTLLLTGSTCPQHAKVGVTLRVPETDTMLIQQGHGVLLHALALAIDAEFVGVQV